MALLAGPFIVAAALLGAGGASKLVRPGNTARALGEMGLPKSPTLVRVGAGAELAIAAAALVGAGRPAAALVSASYVAFAAVVAVALRRSLPLSTCGCFGVTDTPPTAVHLALNVAAAGAAGAVAFGAAGAGGLAEITALDGSMVVKATFVVLTATSTWFAYVALTALPKLAAHRQ